MQETTEINPETTSEEIAKEELKNISFDKEKTRTLVASNDNDKLVIITRS